jgi:hypothetical protein
MSALPPIATEFSQGRKLTRCADSGHGGKPRLRQTITYPAVTIVGIYDAYDNLAVLYESRMPAVLFEAGIMVNRDEE